MLTNRIIACLDIKDGRVVKGVSFKSIQDAGNPIELAQHYNQQGCDELVFLDITASHERRRLQLELISRLAKVLFIPFTIGGGINSIEDIRTIISNGADKVSINSSALTNPGLIEEGAQRFGSQCIVVAIDAKQHGNGWQVYSHGGRKNTGRDALEWAKEAALRGAGEILLTSMDQDGRQNGYDLELTACISQAVSIPVIASGGGGTVDHFYDVFTNGHADAALAASIFHYATLPIPQLKNALEQRGIPIRPAPTAIIDRAG